ncbi:MAG TPA: sugar phosphate isomerase/epimerase [Desulfobacterales bacterium]|nr:sugar phosphate isomerase/epimerase [Desulfobacterales bacterium]
MHPIGVSPAYYISRFTHRFTPDDVADSLGELARQGFHTFQLEVFHRENLDDWRARGAGIVRRQSIAHGLQASQFVAHFMLEDFADRQNLISNAAIEQMKVVLDIVDRFEECRVITVPLPAFEDRAASSRDNYLFLFERCAGKLSRLMSMVENAGRRMALEILPGAIVGGIDGFLRLCEHLGTDTLGLNFDTGHAWACKENFYLIPAKLGPRILGTHLCDNFGNENLSLRPGAGSIDWPRLVAALKACGYNGPWDIEIVCPPNSVAEEYGAGRRFIEALV